MTQETTASALPVNDTEQLRNQLLANGYTPLPNLAKACMLKGWPTVTVDAETIHSWARRNKRFAATGIRVENGLCVIDIDVDHAVVEEIAAAIEDIIGIEAANAALIRYGKGRKEAWFVRTSEIFSRIHSRRWVAPGSSADAGTHSVEIFGGASPRQFGSFGAHTLGDDGRVLVSYEWDGPSPADTPLGSLPVITKAQAYAIADAAETVLERRGFEPVARSTKGESDAVRTYDLDDTMHFDMADGRRLSLSELRVAAAAEDGLRCSASWLEGATATNTSRCLVSLTRSGHVAVWESASGVTHVEAAAKPRDFELELDRVAEKLKELEIRTRNRLHPRDGAVVAAAKLLETYAFCPSQAKAPVVPVYTSAIDRGLTVTNFRLSMLPHADEEIGPRGGRQVINPVDIWMGSEKRISVEGTQLRPDRPRPTYEDADGLWINAYDPPAHDAAGGDAAIGLEFMEQLVPHADERRWWMQWLAHKFLYPHIPGPGVVMVAHQTFGTGRGTFREFAGRLFGQNYVKEMPYAMVAGRTYQSQYTDWAADALLIVVNESSETEPGGSAYTTKRNTYERLKELVDPRPSMRTFIAKGRAPFKALSCASYIIATNHMDAMPIPDDDRRFTVLRNGGVRPVEYWERLQVWMDDPANVAAFAAHLRTVDLTGYSPFAVPPAFEGKLQMVEESKSDLDRALEWVIVSMPSPVMLIEQVIAGLRMARQQQGYDYPDNWEAVAKRLVRARLHRVGIRDSTNWQVVIDNRKYAVYARDATSLARWKLREDLRQEVLRNGSAAATGLPGNVLVGLFTPPK